MPTPSPEIAQLLSVFAVAFTAPTFANALVLTYGTILAPRRHIVAAALREWDWQTASTLPAIMAY